MNKNVVVLATYNGEKYIEEQLESIKRQTVLPDEVKIFDDGSSDKTIDILKKYISDNKQSINITININPINKGYAKNFIDGILNCENDLVFLCDQDDIWKENKIEVMSKFMSENPNIDLLCSNLEPFYMTTNTRKWNRKLVKEMSNAKAVELPIFNSKNFHLRRSGCTMCVRSAFMKKIKEYWIEGWAHDDFLWKYSVLEGSCAILPNITIKRRMHENNTTVIRTRKKSDRINQLNNLKKQYEKMLEFINNGNNEYSQKIIEKNIVSIEKRLKVIEKKSLIEWFNLLFKYRNCYPRLKGLFFDLYIAFFNEYRGV